MAETVIEAAARIAELRATGGGAALDRLKAAVLETIAESDLEPAQRRDLIARLRRRGLV